MFLQVQYMEVRCVNSPSLIRFTKFDAILELRGADGSTLNIPRSETVIL